MSARPHTLSLELWPQYTVPYKLSKYFGHQSVVAIILSIINNLIYCRHNGANAFRLTAVRSRLTPESQLVVLLFDCWLIAWLFALLFARLSVRLFDKMIV